jgi:hypothetical protein
MIRWLEEDGQQQGIFGPDQGWSQSDQSNGFLCTEVETQVPMGLRNERETDSPF